MKIYFAGSIRGGRDDKELYSLIIELLSTYGQVLTEHVGNKNLTAYGEERPSDRYIYHRDMNWLETADVIIAEVTTPSLGVGYEIAKAEEWKKKILCLYRETEGKRLSAMISGSEKLVIKKYESINDLKDIFEVFFETSIKNEWE